ncbi:hypothetical protein Nepgr_015882 [Nepenthes gracilis]|uniref:Uncharacterized protein n=1 Tax=Nepenthes gracilis TaxID=150966 RepID=A0AAD3XRQ4_NEPGR|nr:hypothetical protein Nepgr_015882 [Nepenthes gracilis]
MGLEFLRDNHIAFQVNLLSSSYKVLFYWLYICILEFKGDRKLCPVDELWPCDLSVIIGQDRIRTDSSRQQSIVSPHLGVRWEVARLSDRTAKLERLDVARICVLIAADAAHAASIKLQSFNSIVERPKPSSCVDAVINVVESPSSYVAEKSLAGDLGVAPAPVS